jgi:hypothetical protein
VWFEPEVEQLGALRIVVVLLELYSRVRYVLDACLYPQLPSGLRLIFSPPRRAAELAL